VYLEKNLPQNTIEKQKLIIHVVMKARP